MEWGGRGGEECRNKLKRVVNLAKIAVYPLLSLRKLGVTCLLLRLCLLFPFRLLRTLG